jgi:repressor LexA
VDTHENIKRLRKLRGYSQEELARMVGYTDRSSIAKIESGGVDLSQSKITAFALALGVTPGQIMGIIDEPDPSPLPSNVVPLRPMKKIPLVGQIACGVPILAEQNIEGYIDLPRHIRADYALTCKGDSMVNAGIRDGDVVYIRQQSEVENGQIAAVMVDDAEATLKRVYFDGSMVQLVAENPCVSPMVFTGQDVSRVHILGLAVGYTHIMG